MKQRIHIFGASGSGTTSIAREVCRRLGYDHFDTDDYFWLPTQTPYTAERPTAERLQMLRRDLAQSARWLLSGSLTGWGDALIPEFQLVVFAYVPSAVHLERLKRREFERYGEQILPGGQHCGATQDFLDWAAAYDSGTRNGRSFQRHAAWLQALPCPFLKIENIEFENSVQKVLDAIHR